MSRWDGYGWYRRAPKKPPPEHGIRMKKVGTTWWGQRWIEALEHVLRGDAARLARGRTYARAGRAHDLVIAGGKVTARVTGSRPAPYEITIELKALGAPAWRQAIAGLAKKAQYSADLLAGQMPQTIDEVFADAGVSLFPKQRTDLVTSCSCPDWGDPCKHVAATHYLLGEALDRDPFLLFELRGMKKLQVLDALRAARGGAAAREVGTAKAAATQPAKAAKVVWGTKAAQGAQAASAPAAAAGAVGAVGEASTARKAGRAKPAPLDATFDVPTVKLGKLKASEYDQPRAPLPALNFSFDAPVSHGALLRQLGAPSAWEGAASPAEVLTPMVRAAAEAARRIAMAEPGVAPARSAEEADKSRPAKKAPVAARGRAAPRQSGR